MIGHIQGIIIEKQPPQLIIDVAGIGYEVDAPMSTFYQLPDCGQTVKLYTQLIIREDGHFLFGFYSKEERALFKTLLKVNGVGPRLALTILSGCKPDELVRNILNNDTASLVRLPGVGKKTAERLVIEMRDKVSNWYSSNISDASSHSQALQHAPRHPILQDAIAALVALGYKQHDANRMVAKIDDGALSSEELIRRALKEVMA
jgi:holliday junction DNA helicase RuvA